MFSKSELILCRISVDFVIGNIRGGQVCDIGKRGRGKANLLTDCQISIEICVVIPDKVSIFIVQENVNHHQRACVFTPVE